MYLVSDVPPAISVDVNSLVDRIIECESGGDHTAQNPVSTAYGLCQFLDGTWNYVQRKWGIKLDRYSYNDQMYACKRLLDEEGERHWEASKHCWNT